MEIFWQSAIVRLYVPELGDYIHIRFLSVEETSEKAARQYKSTIAVFRLSELLTMAKKVGEVEPKRVCLCIPLAELLCPQGKNFCVKQKAAVLRTACFLYLSCFAQTSLARITGYKKRQLIAVFLFPL